MIIGGGEKNYKANTINLSQIGVERVRTSKNEEITHCRNSA